MTYHAYLPAIEIRPGDRLPEVSRFPVLSVEREGTGVLIRFEKTMFTRLFEYHGPDFGWECTRIERG